jgi:hypothetical protein
MLCGVIQVLAKILSRNKKLWNEIDALFYDAFWSVFIAPNLPRNYKPATGK